MVFDSVFPVISDATRRRILEELLDGDLAVGELVERLGVSQPTVSKHLKVLREAQLVSTRAEGQRRYYGVEVAGLVAAAEWFTPFAELAATAGRTPSVLRPTVHPAGASGESARAARIAETVGAPPASGETAPAGQPARDGQVVREGQPKEFGRAVGATVEQVADRAQHLLNRLPKPRFPQGRIGRRR
ncbi:metalloregulator ArsR/SmtB family transcription factor [Zhihengliuella sp.]|uniref:ArsR/SmtB family transcription factor n=1 Tax=Zhihengliuella sp. TaxID=1954483 RepID=UPI00281201E6|nr:metalloregulator ArsR/SmtB family transcription factor [Zhihengliuella sp.]